MAQITATIDQVWCVAQSEGAAIPVLDPTSEPYLWAAMFVIDGFQVLIVDPPRFTLHVPDPPLRIQVNQGNHGNLYAAGSPFPARGVDNGDVLAVPPEAGFFQTFVRRLELPPPCDPLLPRGVQGIAGVVAILLEHDNLDEDDAERGHQAFNAALADVLTDFVEGRSVLAGTPGASDTAAMAAAVQQRIEAEIQRGFGVDDVLDVVQGLDHSLGSAVWTFRIGDLLKARERFSATLTARPNNEWVVNGSAHAIDDCLVNAVNTARVARGDAALDDAPLRRIRQSLSPRTAQVVRDALGAAGPPLLEVFETEPDLEEWATRLFRRFTELAPDDDARVPAAFVEEATALAERLAAASPPAQRREVARLAALLPLAADRTFGELRELAEANPAAVPADPAGRAGRDAGGAVIDRARVTIWLHRLFCHEGYDSVLTWSGFRVGVGVAEPYVWPVLFAIDGRDALIRSPEDDEGSGGDLVLGGRASIQTSTGSPDNMGVHGFELATGEETRVPGATGYFMRESPAIRLPFPCDPLKPEGALGTVGLAVALFDHDELPHDSIRSGYDTFAISLQKEISDVIDGAPVIGAGNLSQGDLDAMSARIGANVKQTIVSSLSTWEKVKFGFGFSNPDDQIGSTVFMFDLPGLVSDVARVERQTIEKSLGTSNPGGVPLKQRWELEVIAIATRFPPEEAVWDVARMHRIAVDETEVAPAGGPWVGPWAALAGDLHGPLLGEMVLDRDLAEAAVAAVRDGLAVRARPGTVVTGEMAERAARVLGALGDRGDRRTALLAGRAARMATGLAGHPAERAVRQVSKRA